MKKVTTMETSMGVFHKTRGGQSMKRIVVLALLATVFVCNDLTARTIIVKVSNVRGDKGTVLVMAQAGKDNKPVYGMAKPENGEATITLENVEWDEFDLSVFHDENDNKQMDLTDNQKPAEGYAMKSCKPQQKEETCKLKMYYPVNE